MPKKIWRVTVRSEFAAAHALRHYKGKCEHIHGHNFAVEAVAQGDKLSEDTELLLDFTVFKAELAEVLRSLDHKDLNEVAPFDRINPSSENLACYIFQALDVKLLPYGVKMHSVTVSERGPQSATYMELLE